MAPGIKAATSFLVTWFPGSNQSAKGVGQAAARSNPAALQTKLAEFDEKHPSPRATQKGRAELQAQIDLLASLNNGYAIPARFMTASFSTTVKRGAPQWTPTRTAILVTKN